MPDIIVIAHNIRSTHNVGSIFRTAEGFGVTKIILSGYTPYPVFSGDTRLPHIAQKLTAQIHKTALGAEDIVPFEYQDHPDITSLRDEGFRRRAAAGGAMGRACTGGTCGRRPAQSVSRL